MKRGRGKGKKEKGIHIYLSNRLSYTLIAVLILAAAGISVYALAPGVIPNPGHDISQMSVPSPCTAGQFLTYNGANWVCSGVNIINSGLGLYKATNAYCTNPNEITYSNQCQAKTTGAFDCSFSGSPYQSTYTCAGGRTCTLTYIYCPNTLLGNVLVG